MYNFTKEDLLQYLYQETSTEKTAAIAAAIQSDFHVMEMFTSLNESINMLNEVPLLSPRKQTIDTIIQYAEKSVKEIHV